MDCKVRYDTYTDTRPVELADTLTRGVCLTHGLWADSDVLPVRDDPSGAQRTQVNDRLAQIHLEYGL